MPNVKLGKDFRILLIMQNSCQFAEYSHSKAFLVILIYLFAAVVVNYMWKPASGKGFKQEKKFYGCLEVW